MKGKNTYARKSHIQFKEFYRSADEVQSLETTPENNFKSPADYGNLGTHFIDEL